MPVDYAKRSAPKKKKGSSKGSSKKRASKGAVRQKKQQKPVSFAKLLLIMLILAVFAFGLWYLKDRSPQSVTPASGITPGAQEALPEIPEEQWQYIEELENKQVEVEVPDRAESQPRLMQCGSFRTSVDAESLRARIAMQGMESQVRESHGSNGRWFRVILGPYENLREAQRENNQLQRAGIHGCKIWLWNLD